MAKPATIREKERVRKRELRLRLDRGERHEHVWLKPNEMLVKAPDEFIEEMLRSGVLRQDDLGDHEKISRAMILFAKMSRGTTSR